MSAQRSPHADPPQPTLRQRGAALKGGISRVLRRPKPIEAGPAAFDPYAIAAPVRTPKEWQERFAPHLLAVHMADRLIRMNRAGVAAFIRGAGERDEDMPVAMLDNLGLAVRECEMLLEMTQAAHARFYVAAGDAIGETDPPAEEPPAAEPRPQTAEPEGVFERIAASTREGAANALDDARVSPDLRTAIEGHRDATLAMLLCPDDSNEASEPLCAAVEASGEALRAVPARSIADVRAKLAFLLPEILPDVNGDTPTAFLKNVFDDVERLARDTEMPTDPRLSPDRAWAVAQAADVDLSGLSILELNNLFGRLSGIAGHWLDLSSAGWAQHDRRSPFADPNAAGRIIEREHERATEIRTRIAAEMAGRPVPEDRLERNWQLETLIVWELECNTDLLHAPELRSRIAAEWSR